MIHPLVHRGASSSQAMPAPGAQDSQGHAGSLKVVRISCSLCESILTAVQARAQGAEVQGHTGLFPKQHSLFPVAASEGPIKVVSLAAGPGRLQLLSLSWRLGAPLWRSGPQVGWLEIATTPHPTAHHSYS